MKSLRPRALLVLAVLHAIGLGALAVHSPNAEAWSIEQPSGYIGATYLPSFSVTDVTTLTGQQHLQFSPRSAVTVARVPIVAGDQYIALQYSVQWWNGSQWVNVALSNVASYRMPAGYSSWAFTVAPLVTTTAPVAGYFRVKWFIGWSDFMNSPIASTFVVSDRSTDHVCATTARLCISYNGFVRTSTDLTRW